MVASAEHLVTSAEHQESKDHPSILPNLLVLVSASAGTVSVAIGGMGILFAGKKREWLHRRFMTERIRQFHFQTFVFRLPEILASLQNDQAKAAFRSNRKGWVEAFKSRFDGKLAAEFSKNFNEDIGTDIWLHEDQRERNEIPDNKDLDPLFRAYRDLRIMHQIGYANYKLKDDHKIFSNAPRRQANVLSSVAFSLSWRSRKFFPGNSSPKA
jgi:hypothetical protein